MSGLNSSRVYFEGSAPILRVEDMKTALAFYVDKLGF
jgi:predicted enzyme related to lactoylglutathione lyase